MSDKKDLITVTALLILLATTWAAGPEEVEAGWNYTTCLALRIIQFIAVGVAVLVIALAGIKLITSGDVGDRERAKSMLIHVIVGLIIIIMAVQLINSLVTGTDVNKFDLGACEETFINQTVPVTTTLPWVGAPSADARVGLSQPPPQLEDKVVYAAPNIEIHFDGSRSMDPDGVIVSYRWDLGDGEEAVGDIVAHTYLDWGNYIIWLTVVDNDGLQASDHVKVMMQALEAHILQPDDGQKFPNKDVPITFLGEGKYGIQSPTYPPYDYTWTSGGVVLSHDKGFTISATDLGVGTHIIELTVEDYAGSTAVDSIEIHVVGCNDSDAGDDPEHGGTLTDYTGSHSDSCYEDNLTEHYCLDEENASKVYNCIVYCMDIYGPEYEGSCELDALNQGFCKCASDNEKDMSKYPTVFLISDEEWRDVLSLNPVAVWTNEEGGNIDKYPLLIYHREGNSFDADSVIYFMQQYGVDNLTIVGDTPSALDNLLTAAPPLGAGLKPEEISRIYPADYFSYWASISKVVVVDYDNYREGLMASVYASLINAPILFLNSGNLGTYSSILDNKGVYVIGDVDSDVSDYISSKSREMIEYSSLELEEEYLGLTSTDKLVLVNPTDLGIKLSGSLTPDKYTCTISELYAKTSLAAPTLASAKHELIIWKESTDYNVIDEFVEDKVNSLGLNRPYLTIVASPPAIPMSKSAEGKCGSAIHIELDSRYYASLGQNYEYIDLPVGRIVSVTISGVSAYIARDLFFEDITKGRDAMVMILEHLPYAGYNSYTEFYTPAVRSEFSNTHTDFTSPADKSIYINDYLILYYDHGDTHGFGNARIYSSDLRQKYLDSPTVIDVACCTCDFAPRGICSSVSSSQIFCTQHIRRGAMVYQGAVDVSYWHSQYDEILNEVFINGGTIGEAVRIAKNSDYDIDHYNFCSGIKGDPFYALIADPTFKPKWW